MFADCRPYVLFSCCAKCLFLQVVAHFCAVFEQVEPIENDRIHWRLRLDWIFLVWCDCAQNCFGGHLWPSSASLGPCLGSQRRCVGPHFLLEIAPPSHLYIILYICYVFLSIFCYLFDVKLILNKRKVLEKPPKDVGEQFPKNLR